MNGLRVLLVEDEALIALHTQDVLCEAGYEVVGPADRLEEALSLAQSEQFHAAVLDVNLAGEFVWPVANILFERGIGFLLLTGFGYRLEIPPSCNGAPRLTKPLSRDDLLAALTTIAQEGQMAYAGN